MSRAKQILADAMRGKENIGGECLAFLFNKMRLYIVSSPLSKGGRNPNFEKENLKKNFGWGNQKGGGEIFKMKLFKLNLWIKKSKNGDFQWQISINFFK